jgi:hypothetical protein
MREGERDRERLWRRREMRYTNAGFLLQLGEQMTVIFMILGV